MPRIYTNNYATTLGETDEDVYRLDLESNMDEHRCSWLCGMCKHTLEESTYDREMSDPEFVEEFNKEDYDNSDDK